jgi:hypothetical protein
VYFYELHEGDDDQFSDLLLARETEMESDVFFDIVQTIRRRVQDTYEHDTLIEAIAEELERDFEFIALTDDRLVAAVNVSKQEADNFLADLEDSDGEDEDEDDDDEDDSPGEDVAADNDFRSLYVDMDPSPDIRKN